MTKKHTHLETFKENMAFMRDLPQEDRLPFLWDYYKVAIITCAAVLLMTVLLVGIAVTMLSGVLQPRQSISLAIAADDLAGFEALVSDFTHQIEKQNGIKTELLVTSGYYEGNMEFEIELVCWLSAGQPDLLICDADTLAYCREQGILAELASCIPPEADPDTLWIDISQTTFASTCNQGGEPVFLCRIAGGTGDERSVIALAQLLLKK